MIKIIFRSASRWIFLLFLATIIAGILPAIEVWASVKLVDLVNNFLKDQQAVEIVDLFIWLSVLIIIMLSNNGFYMCQRPIRTLFDYNLNIHLKKLLVDHTNATEYAVVESADYQNRLHMVNNFSQRIAIAAENLLKFMRFFFSLISLLGILLVINGYIALILTLGTIPTIFLSMKIQKKLHKTRVELAPREREMHYYEDILSGYQASKEIRVFHLGSYLIERWKNLINNNHKKLISVEGERVTNLFFSRLIGVFSYIGSIIILISLVIRAQCSLGTYAGVANAMRHYQRNIRDFVESFVDFTGFLYDIDTMRKFFENQTGKIKENNKHKPKATIKQGININNISFRYPGHDHLVLSDINVFIPAGERIAIIGENGAGKTTFIKLLLGFYNPSRGRITIDGIDLKDIEKTEYRNTVSGVVQEFVQYQLSARDNIGLGSHRDIHNLDLIRHAALKVGIDDVISSLPKSYETLLGTRFEESCQLSGGQWQKIAIARAFMRDAVLLVFDEPTASLDPMTEVDIFHKFSELARGKTSFFISHRIGSARFADRILVFRKGQLVETGNHSELIDCNGYYAELFKAQAEWYQVGVV
jgi:ATP-binding cassette, subfamily B, bacterial